MSVRSTNVYEEQSLGVFEAEESDEEPTLPPGKDGVFGYVCALCSPLHLYRVPCPSDHFHPHNKGDS